jgi:PAS domain S-box-containing protein
MADIVKTQPEMKWGQLQVHWSRRVSSIGYVSLALATIFGAVFAAEWLGSLLNPSMSEWIVHGSIAIILSAIVFLSTRALQHRWSLLQEHLQQAEARYQALVEHIPAITYTMSLGSDSQTLFISPQVESLLGFPRERWLDDPYFWQTRLHPDDRERVCAEVEQACVAGKPIALEYRMIAQDGRVIWFSDSASPTCDEKGQPIQYQGALFDITEMKHGEEGLAQLAAIVQSSDDSIISVTPDDAIATWNAGAERLYGYTAQEIIGKPISAVFPPGQAEEELAHVSSPWEGQTLRHIETTRLHKDGRLVDVSLTISPVRDSHGRVIASMGVGRDNTARRQAEHDLQQSERKYRSIIEQSTDGIVLTDERGAIVVWNMGMARITGLARDAAMGQPVWDFALQLLPAEARTPALYDFMRTGSLGLLQGDSAIPITEAYGMSIQRPDGARRDIEATCFTIDAGPGKMVSVICRDVTERKEAVEELRAQAEQYAAILTTTPDGFCVADSAGRLLDVNETFCRITGYSRDELLKLTIPDLDMDVVEPEALRRRPQIMQRGWDRFEMRHRTKDGRGIDVEISTTYLAAKGLFVAFIRNLTAHKLAEQQIQRQLISLRALHSGAQDLAQSLDSAKLAQDVAHACVETFGVSLAWVGRAEPDGRVQPLTQFPLDSDYLRQATVRWDDKPEGSGAMGTAIRSGSPTVFADLKEDVQTTPLRKLELEQGYRSVAAFPLISRHRTFGALALYSEQPDFFTPERVQFFQSYALLAATALENARLFEETERRLSQVQALRRIDTAISSSLDLRATLDVILDQTTTQLAADAADILLYEPLEHLLVYKAGRGFHSDAVRHTRLPLGQPYAGQAALERRTTMIDHRYAIDEASLTPAYRTLLGSEGFIAHAATPLIAKGQVVGVLEIFHRTPLDTSGDWQDLLETLAGQAAIAIDNATLFDSLQRSNADLELAYDATLVGWSRAMDLRDKVTEGHTQRVAEMAINLASALDLSGAEQVQLYRGALLHDIGKLGVPDAILFKPRPLTEEEWAIMRKHPQYAYDMLFPVKIKYLRPALDVPYCHHEKWDGTGYPRRLKGEQIPLLARIFAVVDVWDALTSDRPYRTAWPTEKARDYIASQSGIHFDPQIVQAFLKLDIAANTAGADATW